MRQAEHPDWKPWWIKYAEFDGQIAILVDRTKLPPAHKSRPIGESLWGVGVGAWSDDPCWCGCTERGAWWDSGKAFDSLAEAEAAFEAAERELLTTREMR